MKKYTWRTHKIIKETKDAITICFDPGHQKFAYLPGQYLNIRISLNGELLIRSYSFCSKPSDEFPAITIKRVIGGKMSNFILDNAADIETWEIEAPFGNFVLDKSIVEQSEIVLLAGGSGISPLFSMLKSIENTNQIPLLVYSNKLPQETIFWNELETMHTNEKLNICYSFTDPEFISTKINHIAGRFSLLVLRSVIKRLVSAVNDAHYYICGPTGLMDLYKDALTGLKIPEENIHMEYFDPIQIDANDMETDCTTKDVIVNYYEDNYVNDEMQTFECTSLIEVQPRQSLLGAMKAHHIKVPSSCRKGTCGACWAVKTGGEIRMLHSGALTEQDIAEGIILLCQSYPLNADVCITVQ
ncbi:MULTISPECIES: iron-sulfur cluster-binding domain-containing protein [Olivibacter]|uniref:FAD-binding oxidoreductase n=2 Tax=Olivibacter TaxID=376469 RepID=A0ABV6HQI8_9SPHI|nr:MULTISPECIES: iron-sulfur cluster-binding domain-containing protein [Olivibacter]MDX3917426.1 iron-sulfur cluster-binding domain-containing protein [Pseudosphingobacterium sp.]QEL03930.1 iron-sulfur cluster-binding domain-containing protein [Olivibacter sp. LS-1]